MQLGRWFCCILQSWTVLSRSVVALTRGWQYIHGIQLIGLGFYAVLLGDFRSFLFARIAVVCVLGGLNGTARAPNGLRV